MPERIGDTIESASAAGTDSSALTLRTTTANAAGLATELIYAVTVGGIVDAAKQIRGGQYLKGTVNLLLEFSPGRWFKAAHRGIKTVKSWRKAGASVPNSTPVGRRSSPGATGPDGPQPSGAGRHNPQHVNGSTQPVQNLPGVVNGREFSGHAFDQMRNRGLTPTVVENAIQTGQRIPGNTPGTSVFVDSANSVRVIVNKAGRVVTVE
jgi:filamentous hemagglutinin